MDIQGIGCTLDKDACASRLVKCRNWIDEQLQNSMDNSNVDIETKKLIADIAQNLVIYIQECSTAVFNCSSTTNND